MPDDDLYSGIAETLGKHGVNIPSAPVVKPAEETAPAVKPPEDQLREGIMATIAGRGVTIPAAAPTPTTESVPVQAAVQPPTPAPAPPTQAQAPFQTQEPPVRPPTPAPAPTVAMPQLPKPPVELPAAIAPSPPTAPAPTEAKPLPTYSEEVGIGTKQAMISWIARWASLVDPLSVTYGLGGMPDEESVRLMRQAPETRSGRLEAGTKALTAYAFPEGEPEPAQGVLRGVLRGVGGAPVALAELGILAPFGGAVSANPIISSAITFALQGITGEKPVEGALHGAALGSVLGFNSMLAGGLKKPVLQYLQKVGGGAAIGGGFTAMEGGGPEEISRDAIVFGLFEAFGIVKHKTMERMTAKARERQFFKGIDIDWDVANAMQLNPDLLKRLAEAHVESNEFADALNKVSHRVLNYYAGGAGLIIGDVAEPRPLVDQSGKPMGETPSIVSPEGTRADLVAALQILPQARNAHQKLLVDNARADARKELMAPMEPRVPEIITGPLTSSPHATMGIRTPEPVTVSRMFGGLVEKVQQAGDPVAAKELDGILSANQNTIGNLFRVERPTRKNLQEISDRILDLTIRIQQDGDPNAARELTRIISNNQETLRGIYHWEIEKAAGRLGETEREVPQPIIPGATLAKDAGQEKLLAKLRTEVLAEKSTNQQRLDQEHTTRLVINQDGSVSLEDLLPTGEGVTRYLAKVGNAWRFVATTGEATKFDNAEEARNSLRRVPRFASLFDETPTPKGMVRTDELPAFPFKEELKDFTDYKEDSPLADPDINRIYNDLMASVYFNAEGKPITVAEDNHTVARMLKAGKFNEAADLAQAAQILSAEEVQTIIERSAGPIERGQLSFEAITGAVSPAATWWDAMNRGERNRVWKALTGVDLHESYQAKYQVLGESQRGDIEVAYLQSRPKVVVPEALAPIPTEEIPTQPPPELPAAIAPEGRGITPKVFQDEAGFWRVEGTEHTFSNEERARKAAEVIGKYRPSDIEDAVERYRMEAASPDEARELAPIFFSHMERQLEKTLPGRATVDQMIKLVEGWAQKGQFKADELKWSGLLDYLRKKEGTATKQDVLDYLRMNQLELHEVRKGAAPTDLWAVVGEGRNEGGAPTYTRSGFLTAEEAHAWAKENAERMNLGDYTLERLEEEGIGEPTKYEGYKLLGGEDYREMLITLPGFKSGAYYKWVEYKDQLKQKYGTEEIMKVATRDEKEMLTSLHKAAGYGAGTVYKSAHWDEPNVLAHVRFIERVDSQGRRTLFLEELQSDWHLELRKKETRAPEEKIRQLVKDSEDAREAKNKAGSRLSDANKNYEKLMEEASGKVLEAEIGRIPKFEKTRITIPTAEGPVQVDAEIYGHFGIQKRYRGATYPPGDLVIVHLPTGLVCMDSSYLSTGKLTKTKAKDIITRLSHSALDWSSPDQSTYSSRGSTYRNELMVFAGAQGLTASVPPHLMPPELRAQAEKLQGIVDQRNAELLEADRDFREKSELANKAMEGIHDAPFSKTWHELVLKRMLRYAAENGYDQMAWISGEKTKERYDLSKHLDRLTYWTRTNELVGEKDDRAIIKKVVPPDKLADFVGKEVAERLLSDEAIAKATVLKKPLAGNDREWIVEGEGGRLQGRFENEADAWARAEQINRDSEQNVRQLSGINLKVGGEWANNLYDRMVPQFLSKYGRHWGAELGTAEFDTAKGAVYRGPEYTVEQLIARKKEITEKLKSGARGGYGAGTEARSRLENLQPALTRMIEDMKAGESFRDVLANEASDVARALGGDYVRESEPYGVINITPQMKEAVLFAGQPMFRAEVTPEDLSKFKPAEKTGEVESWRLSDLTIEERLEAFKESPFWQDLNPEQQRMMLAGERNAGPHPALLQFLAEIAHKPILRDVGPMALYPDGYLQSIQRFYRAAQEVDFARTLSTDMLKERAGDYGTVSTIDSKHLREDQTRGWLITLKNEQMIFIFESTHGSLEMSFGKQSGREWEEMGVKQGLTLGTFKPWTFGSVAEIARGRGIRTVDHELWHHIEYWLLTPAERRELIREFGPNEEVRAEAYAKWDPREAPHTIFGKILAFFQNLIRTITGRPDVESIFAKARRGEMFERDPEAYKGIEKASDGRIEAAGDGIRAGMTTYSGDVEEFIKLAEQFGYADRATVEKFVSDANSVFNWMVETPEAQFEWNRQYSSIKTNSDWIYKYSEDYSTLCKKRGFITATVDEIQKRLGRFLTAGQPMDVREDLESLGYETGCGPCYVDAKRDFVSKLGNRWLEAWKALEPGTAYNPDPDAPKSDPGRFFYTGRTTAVNKAAGLKTPYSALEYINAHGKPDIPDWYFLTSYGQAKLKAEYPEIYKTFSEKVNAGTLAKSIELHTEYNREWIERTPGGGWKISDGVIAHMNQHGGARSQSWSDFQLQHMLDKMQAIFDGRLRNLKRHSYTKVEDYVDLNGLTGEKLNMSIVPEAGNGINPETGDYTISPKWSIGWEAALERTRTFKDTAGITMLCVSDEHILKARDDPNVHTMIPFHENLRGKTAMSRLGMEGWKDYTKEQSFRDAETGRTLEPKKADDAKRVPHWEEFARRLDADGKPDPNGIWVTDPLELIENFMEICADRKLDPPFKRFARDADGDLRPGYMKLIADVKIMHDGEILPPQRVAEPIFDTNVLKRLMEKFTESPTPLGEDPVEQVVAKHVEALTEAKVTPEAMGAPLPEEIAPTKFRREGRLPPEEERARQESMRKAGLPATVAEFKRILNANDGELRKALTGPGSTQIPIYEGESRTSRAGYQIIDENHVVRTLKDADIYERFYNPQRPYAEGQAPPDPRVGPPDGQIADPPEKTTLSGIREKWETLRLSLKQKISVGDISDLSDQAFGSVKEQMGWGARQMAEIKTVLDKHQGTLGKLRGEEVWDFTDKSETGRVGELPEELQAAGAAWREISDGLWKLADAEKDGGLAYWINYFPRNCKNPEASSEIIRRYLDAKGLTGQKGGVSFLKARTRLLTSELFRPKEQGGLGLEPISENYVMVMMGNALEKVGWLTDMYIRKDLQAAGFIQKAKEPLVVGVSQPTRPIGWVETPNKGVWRGFYAHPDVAAVIERHTDTGLRNDPLYKLYYTPFAAMNEVFVGFSGFHAIFETVALMSQGVGMNVPRGLGALFTGDLEAAGFHMRQLGKMVNIPGALMEGGRYGKQYSAPGTYPELEPMLQMLQRGGMRYKSESARQMVRAFVDAVAESPLNLPRQIVKAFAWPIMGQLVPRFKTFAMVRRLENELFYARREAAARGEVLTKDQETKIAQAVTREGDAVYGQMVYDNLGMKKAYKDILAMWIGFPGWNLGSFRVIKDALSGVLHLVKEPIRYGIEALTPGKEATWKSMSREQRMGTEFFLGMTLVMAIGGSIIQRLLAGVWPEDHKDLFFPRTGGTLPNGQPERVRMPTYMRDVLSLQHPISMLAHKQAFPFRLASALVSNMDYFGTEIRDPWAPFTEQVQQTGEYLGKSLLPFGIQGLLKAQTPGAKAASIVGITPAPREYTNTPAQNIIDEYNKMTRATITSHETAAMKKTKSDLMKLAREEDEEGFKDAAKEAVESGQITREQVKEVIKDSKLPPGISRFTKLPLEWAMRAWQEADSDEKETWAPYFFKKLMSEKGERLIKYRPEVEKVLAELGFEHAGAVLENLTVPEQATRFDTTGLGVITPPKEMAGESRLDTAIAETMEKAFAEKGIKIKLRPGLGSPLKKKKVNPYEVLGL